MAFSASGLFVQPPWLASPRPGRNKGRFRLASACVVLRPRRFLLGVLIVLGQAKVIGAAGPFQLDTHA